MSVPAAPSLIDRLMDLNPQSKTESDAAGSISPRDMRNIMRRDLIALLTTIRLEEVVELDGWKRTSRSVLNYGVRDLSGVPEQNIDGLDVQNTLRQAIWDFEPRLERTSVAVELIPFEDGEMRGIAKLQISGRWKNEIYQTPVFIEAEINFETGDPYVERLLEGFAFLMARVRLRMDMQYPEFTQNLLGLLYPNLTAPTPSCAVFEMKPNYREGALTGGFTLNKGKSIIGRPEGADSVCEFLLCRDTILRPLVMDEAEYTEKAPELARWFPQMGGVESAIRLRIRIASDAPIASLNLEPLSLFIAGESSQPDRIIQALLSNEAKIFAYPVGDTIMDDHRRHPLTIRHDGFADDEAILPQSVKTFTGHRLLQEAFIMPEAFRFVSLTGIEEALRGHDSRVFDIVIGLSETVPEFAQSVTADAFRLHCAPAINLFKRRADRVAVSAGQSEHLISVDRTRPQDFEVYEVLEIEGVTQGGGERTRFDPVFQPSVAKDVRPSSGYFNTRRSSRLVSTSKLSGYLGTDVYVRLANIGGGPAAIDIDQIIVKTLCTNRGLASRLTNKSVYSLQTTAPVTAVTALIGPTPPRAPLAHDSAGWDLINALSLNHLSLSGSKENNAAWLQRLLGLFMDPTNEVHRQITKAFCGLETKIVNRRLPTEGPVSYGRGLEIKIIVDREKLRGTGSFILCSVLERFFQRAATLNSFTQTKMGTPEQAELAAWPVRIGTRHVL